MSNGSSVKTDSDILQSSLLYNVDYNPVPSNWYTARPYGFKFTDRNGRTIVMYLPLSPENLTITTHFATNIVPTLYGTVEEHSPVRYHDITIEGTTGMTPQYVKPYENSDLPQILAGRTSFPVKQEWNTKAAGFFTKTLNIAQNTYDEAKSLLKQEEVSTGVQLDQTGYMAFHNLYRFLKEYKKDAAGESSMTPRRKTAAGNDVHPLVFFNYKDNNQYNVVVRSMTLRRHKDDPMLYHYHILLRGYDLTGADKRANTTSLQDVLGELGLAGVDDATFLTKARELSTKAKSVLGSVATGINQLGR